MSTEQTAVDTKAEQAESRNASAQVEAGSAGKPRTQPRPRAISNPNDVAQLVLMQVGAVNAKKDELTIAAKGLADIAKQLVRAYGEHTATIRELQQRLTVLEEKRGEEA